MLAFIYMNNTNDQLYLIDIKLSLFFQSMILKSGLLCNILSAENHLTLSYFR